VAMAKSFRFPRWVEKTRTYSIHPVAFIDQPFAAPHQSFLAIGSEVPIAKKSSFPSGEAEGKKPYAFTIHPTVQFRGLRADAIRPYGLGGEAAAIHRTTQLRTLREAKSLPYMASAILQSSCKSIRFCLKMAEKNGII